jgi:Zn-dependent protease
VRVENVLSALAGKETPVFGNSIRLFSIFGFEVKVDLSWLIIVGLLLWTVGFMYFQQQYPDRAWPVYLAMGIAAVGGLFVSIVFHELCHSLVARRYGLEMKGITLFIFGGVAEMREEPPSAKAELLMALAGPSASVALAGVSYGIAALGEMTGWPVTVSGVLLWLALLNVILAAFNLLPAFPLDGGRVLRAILWSRSRSLRKATQIASRLGAGLGLGLAVLGGVVLLTAGVIDGLWMILIGLFIRGAARQGYHQVLIRDMLRGEPVERFMTAEPVTVTPETSLADFVEDYVYRHHHKMYPVVDAQGHLDGCITTLEVKDTPRDHWGQMTVGEKANEPDSDNSISPSADAVDALGKMRNNRSSRLMVVRDGRVEGIIALKDLMEMLSMKIDLEGAASDEELPAAARQLKEKAEAVGS